MLPSLFFSLPLDRQSPLVDLYQKFAEYDSHMANMSGSGILANALQERLRMPTRSCQTAEIQLGRGSEHEISNVKSPT